MQLRATRLTAIASAVKRAISAFNVRSLFASGAPGVWYDPSDMSTLFQDVAGTTPVTAVEQPVGLMLDKSQGLVLGPQLVTNGDFSAGGTGWSITKGSVTFSSSGATFAAGVDTAIRQTISLVSGRSYQVTFDLIDPGNFGVNAIFTGASVVSQTFIGTGSKTAILFNGAANTRIDFDNSNNNFAGTIDNISVKELPGNHAFQSTSASRPVLSARYNLLTKTEQFNDGAWTKSSGLTVSANTTTAPDGTLTADTINCITGANAAWTAFTSSSLVAATYTLSCSVLKGKSFNLTIDDATANGAGVYFNGVSGAATNVFLGSGWQVTSSSCVSHPQDSNYWLASATIVRPTTTSSSNVAIRPNTNNTATYSGICNLGDTLVIWGAQLVVTNSLTSNAYQRVNTSTDYNTTGFLPFLKFDGIDDSLSTNSISFTSTDKMSVFAGVRRPVDTAGMIIELSASAFSNPNTFNLVPGNNALALTGPGFGGVSRGTGGSGGGDLSYAYSLANYAPPVTAVVSALYNIAGDTKTIRANGASGVTNTGDQGTGNYGNYPIFIGRRNNASLPFNGQLYSIIIVGKAVNTVELTVTEDYINQQTGAY